MKRLALAVAVVVVAAGCGSSKHAATTTAAAPTSTGVSHAAPDLEAMLPGSLDGKSLKKGSTTGAVVFGGDAFSRLLKTFLRSAGKSPSDLRFANAQSRALDLEAGVFNVPGIAGTKLAQAIVDATKPNSPGLAATPETVGGKAVTRMLYPGGSLLYLYPHGELVFYVGTQSARRAGEVLSQLP